MNTLESSLIDIMRAEQDTLKGEDAAQSRKAVLSFHFTLCRQQRPHAKNVMSTHAMEKKEEMSVDLSVYF